MLTVDDFISKYETYTDEELYDVYKNKDSYSENAGIALDAVLAKNGGLEPLIKRLEEKAIIAAEKRRISKEAEVLGLNGVDASFIKNTTSSSLLSAAEMSEIIETNVAMAEAHLDDKKVNSETVMRSLLGCGVATLVNGAFWSLQLVYFGATSVLMIIGMGLICYGIVKLITKKTFNNPAVILASAAAFILSCLLGYVVFSIVGYLG